jgi:hypothetical protein
LICESAYIDWISLKVPLLLLGWHSVQVVLAVFAPPRMFVVAVAVQVDPQLLLRVVLYAGVSHVVQPVQRARHDVRQLVLGQVLVDVLRLLQQLADVRPRPHAVGQPSSCVPHKREDGHAGRPLAFEQRVVPGLASQHGQFFGDGRYCDLPAVLARVDPGLGRVGVPLELLPAVVLDPLVVLGPDWQRDLVHGGLLVDLLLAQRQQLLLPLDLAVVIAEVDSRVILLVDEVVHFLLSFRALAVLRHILDGLEVVEAFHRAPLFFEGELLRLGGR